MSTFDLMMAWEDGDIEQQDEVRLFQGLIDSGQAWTLQGMYGRHAMQMIEAGLCKLPKTGQTRLVR